MYLEIKKNNQFPQHHFLRKSAGGVSLYLSLMVMTLFLSIALGISSIFLGQIKTIKAMGDSVLAFYAADAGIEKVLILRSNPSSSCAEADPCDLDNGAQYYIVIQTKDDPNCSTDNFCITSIGIYKEARRAIEIKY